ncbi:hypothetical protein [Antarctobacter jejuensis]|uniref:hypothetical protein n=1 Tax=Antarctobacter jejuensis TaxID=1439938 RepID=UPI003FD3EE6F
MLNGLDQIDWAGLQHASGPATDVPAALRAIALGGSSQATRAIAALSDVLCHQDTRYTGTVAAIPFLAELALRPGPHVPGLLHLLRAIAAPSCQYMLENRQTTRAFYADMARRRATQGNAEQIYSDTYGISPMVEADCHARVAEALPHLLPLLTSASPAQVAAMLMLMAEFPGQWSDSAPLIFATLKGSPVPAVQRAAMAALGRLARSVEAGPVDPVLRDWLSPRHAPPLRAEAALAITSKDPERHDTLRDALTSANLLYRNDVEERPIYGRRGWTVTRVADCFARWRGDYAQDTQTVAAILAALPQAAEAGAAPDPLVRAALKTLARSAPIEGMFRGRRRSSLSSMERAVLNAIVTHGPWQIGDSRNGNFAGLMHRCGLPDTPEALARFATPPGALARLLRR